ncbi:MAG: hypothetical protein HQK67_11460 [Desulfamplus sp.]|nr:hypothetical protein [Desulfamplus sp.]
MLPKAYAELGDLVSIDGSLIDAVLSMYWAITDKVPKKPKVILDSTSIRGYLLMFTW